MSAYALLCPGQGAQAVGMGRAWYDASAAARETFAAADAVLGFPLSKLCFEGPAEELTRTDNAQVAIYVTSVAAVRGARESGRVREEDCQAAAGLSLGEYTALHLAGSFDFESGVRLVRVRGEAMQAASEAAASGMVSLIGADEEKATALCEAARQGGVLVVANLNAPGQVVISGDREACTRAVAEARRHGIRRAVALDVAGAFHSPLMAPAQERLNAALAETVISDPQVPVWANATARVVRGAEEVREALGRQLTAPVRWAESLQGLLQTGIERFYEPEPGRVLAGLMRKIDAGAQVEPLAAETGGAA